MFCGNCGNNMPEGARFCSKCGWDAASANQGQQINQQAQQMQQMNQQAQQLNQQMQQMYQQPYQQYQPAGTVVNVKHKSHFGAKLALTLVIILGLLVGGFFGYCKLFVSGPEETVAEFFDDLRDYDINSMMDCMDSSTRSAYSAVLGLTDSLMSSFTGISGVTDLAELMPYLTEIQGIDSLDFEVTTGNIEYTGGPFAALKNKTIDKLFAKEAYVTIIFTYEGQSETDTVKLVNEGLGKWKIDGSQLGM